MTPESREFIASARKFMAQFKGLFAEIEELEKVDQLVREGEARLGALREEEAQQRGNLDNYRRQVETEMAQRFADSERQIVEKHRKADELVAEAEDQAGRIVKAARDEAADFAARVAGHVKALAEHKSALQRITDEIALHHSAREDAAVAAAAARQQHEDEKAALRAFRASLPQ